MIPRSIRRALLAPTVAVALIAPAFLAVAGAGPANALEPIPPIFATWHEQNLASPASRIDETMTDAAGAVWYADNDAQEIVRIDPLTTAMTAFTLGPSNPRVGSMVQALDGNIWFADHENLTVDRLDVVTGVVDLFDIGALAAAPRSIVAGADGALWFGVPARGLIRMTLDGRYTVLAEPTGEVVSHTTATADGRIWYALQNTDQIGVYNPKTSSFTHLVVPGASPVRDIEVSLDGDVWALTDDGISQIAADVSSTTLHLFPGTGTRINPSRLVAGIHAEMYFIDGAGGFGRVDGSGMTTLNRIPFSGFRSSTLAIDGFGSLWVSDWSRNVIAWV